MKSTFADWLNVIDALAAQKQVRDDEPLANHIPGVWPTVGDLRKLVHDFQLEREHDPRTR